MVKINIKRKAGEFVLILCIYLLQVTVGRSIAIGGIMPNLLIISPVIFGFLNGRNEGMYTGITAGIFYDLFNYKLFGFSALIFLFIGYFAGYLHDDYEENKILIPIIIVAGGDFIFEFLSYIGNFLLHNKLNIAYFVSRYIIPEMVYTVVVTVVLYKILGWFNTLLDTRDKRSKDN